MGGLDRVFRGRWVSQQRSVAAIVAGLWRNGEQGAWYDPSDLSTMFQDASGTTPVYMPGQGQPDCWIGLQLDKRRGLTRGPEMLSNGDFSGGAAGWGVAGADATHVVDFTGGACRYRSDTTSPVLTVSQGSLSIVAGRWYELTIVVSSWVSGGIKTDSFSGAAAGGLALASSAGTFRAIGLATSTTSVFSFLRNAANTDLTIDSISVRELPGNHRWQGTATSRPTLSARYNLLTSSEDFSSAAWGKSALSVLNGKLTPDATNGEHFINSPAVNFVAGAPYRMSVEVKAAERNWLRIAFASNAFPPTERAAWFNLSGGAVGTVQPNVTAKIDSLGDGWFRCSIERAATTTTAANAFVVVCPSDGQTAHLGDSSSGLYLRAADIRSANDGVGLPPYQRVVDPNTYDTVGFPLYRRPDGVDDWMQTSAVDFSATDKVTIAAAVRKLSDTAGMFVESSSDSSTVNGTFGVNLAPGALAGSIGARLRGTASAGANAAGHAAPKSLVAVIPLDIAKGSWDSSMSVRVNGVPQTTVQEPAFGTSVGIGNFGNHAIYFDRRGGVTLPSGARDYGTIILGRLLTAPETAAVEKLLRSKSRAY